MPERWNAHSYAMCIRIVAPRCGWLEATEVGWSDWRWWWKRVGFGRVVATLKKMVRDKLESLLGEERYTFWLMGHRQSMCDVYLPVENLLSMSCWCWINYVTCVLLQWHVFSHWMKTSHTHTWTGKMSIMFQRYSVVELGMGYRQWCGTPRNKLFTLPGIRHKPRRLLSTSNIPINVTNYNTNFEFYVH